MPDPLRIRNGAFDDPPATGEASTPQTRRNRLRRALQSTSDLASDQPAPRAGHEISSTERRRLGIIGPTSRRRQRSESDLDEESLPDNPLVEEPRRPRPKRRRVGSPPPLKQRKPIKYGYYGQVEQGRLKLELVSCDGGEHRDPRNSASLGPENLLKHDKSVYCSERKSCNIIFRHADDTPFALEKLHIIAPEHGFTAPVRAGVVYVSMAVSDLQKHLAIPGARINDTTAHRIRRTQRSIQPSPERLTLADALRDPEVNAAFDERERERDLTSDENLYDADFIIRRAAADPHCEDPSLNDPSLRVSSFNDPAYNHLNGRSQEESRPIAVILDEEPGPEDASPQEVLDYRLQRLRTMRRRFEIENWDRDDRWSGLSRLPPRPPPNAAAAAGAAIPRHANISHIDALMARSRVHDSAEPDDLPLLESLAPIDDIYPEAFFDRIDDKDVATSSFLISREKHRVAIKFDPPVSGRFIMIKFWSGRSNVDVQTVIAKGYGGCRFFPAVEAR